MTSPDRGLIGDQAAPSLPPGAVVDRALRIRQIVEGAADRLVPRAYSRHREELQYLAIGAWNTLFGYSVWALFQLLLGGSVNYLVIVALSYPIAVLNAYLGYRYVVFRSHGPVWMEFPRFSAVYVAVLVANVLALPVLLGILPFNLYAVQALFTAVVIISSYVAHRSISFRDEGGPRSPAGPPSSARPDGRPSG